MLSSSSRLRPDYLSSTLGRNQILSPKLKFGIALSEWCNFIFIFQLQTDSSTTPLAHTFEEPVEMVRTWNPKFNEFKLNMIMKMWSVTWESTVLMAGYWFSCLDKIHWFFSWTDMVMYYGILTSSAVYTHLSPMETMQETSTVFIGHTHAMCILQLLYFHFGAMT